jgi:hypothetical protein
MQTFDAGTKGAIAVDPMPPRTEAPILFQQELEQRHADAMSKREYHSGEAHAWQAVAQACQQALKSLSQPQQATEGFDQGDTPSQGF